MLCYAVLTCGILRCVLSAGGGEASEEECLDSAFFWIDVMCKNQHKPAPAMKGYNCRAHTHYMAATTKEHVLLCRVSRQHCRPRLLCGGDVPSEAVGGVSHLVSLRGECWVSSVVAFGMKADLIISCTGVDSLSTGWSGSNPHIPEKVRIAVVNIV